MKAVMKFRHGTLFPSLIHSTSFTCLRTDGSNDD